MCISEGLVKVGVSIGGKLGSLRKRNNAKLLVLIAVFLICFFVSFMLGRYPVSPEDLLKGLFGKIFPVEKTWSDAVETVLFQIRLPRVIAAVLIGAALSSAGVAYQGLFQNPLVSPDVLGASAGAGFGAALAISLSFSFFVVSMCAFAFGIGAVLIASLIGSRVKGNPVLGMVLGGIMIGSLFSSGTSFLKLVADTTEMLPAITYWLMGSLASIRQQDVLFACGPIFLGVIPLILLRWRLNILTMGEEEARTLGVNTKAMRFAVIGFASLATSASVAISGMIGWVGLVIPHFARMVVGSDNKVLIPASILMGSSFLLTVDNIARLLTTTEIPLGILTSFVGAPFFIFLIIRKWKRA